MASGPQVSVIIPVLNGAPTLARAIESALGQRFDRKFEVIVVNDGSTDYTAEVMRGYGNRIIALHGMSRGVSAARNAGARAARGTYLAFLDADDEWMPEKLARTVPLLDAEPECVLAYHDAVEIDAAGRVQRSSYYYNGYSSPQFEELLTPEGHAHILPTAVVMRRFAFERCGGFDEGLTSGEDFYMWIRAREQGSFLFVPEPLARREFVPSPRREEWYLAGARELDRVLSERYNSYRIGDFLFATLLWCAAAAFRRGDYRAAVRRSVAALKINPARGISQIATKLRVRISARGPLSQTDAVRSRRRKGALTRNVQE